MTARKADNGIGKSGAVASYDGDGFVVLYDSNRCVHAAECVRCAPEVFDPFHRPWVKLEGANALRLCSVVDRCPSGALRIVGPDGESLLPKPDANSIDIAQDGPLEFRGNLSLQQMDGQEVFSDTRLTLCRCGRSNNKPFCDNAHGEAGFHDRGCLGRNAGSDEPSDAENLTIAPSPNGPLLVNGPCTIDGSDGSVHATKVALCRCGHSNNKPYCDGSHSAAGFRSE